MTVCAIRKGSTSVNRQRLVSVCSAATPSSGIAYIKYMQVLLVAQAEAAVLNIVMVI